MTVRINKYLADSGLASRRKCDDIINAGKVTINGIKAVNGTKVDPETDVVEVSGTRVTPHSEHEYLILNKPIGYITTSSDEHGRKTVMDLLPPELKKRRVYPVGRLDYDSRGLIFLTNDGNLAHKIIHPKHHIEKEYLVEVKGNITEEKIQKLSKGVNIGDYVTQPATVAKEDNNILRFVIWEGKHRQIRRMCEKVGLEVKDLQRVRVGNLVLDNLPEGANKALTITQVQALRDLI